MKIRFRIRWPRFALSVTVRIYTANENDPFVYIAKARKQLTELETLWAVESADTRIFNKLRPIILFCMHVNTVICKYLNHRVMIFQFPILHMQL